MKNLTYIDAVKEAIAEEMERDPRVYLIGEDVDIDGGVWNEATGLLDDILTGVNISDPLNPTIFVVLPPMSIPTVIPIFCSFRSIYGLLRYINTKGVFCKQFRASAAGNGIYQPNVYVHLGFKEQAHQEDYSHRNYHILHV